jgi:hypothetical protein
MVLALAAQAHEHLASVSMAKAKVGTVPVKPICAS